MKPGDIISMGSVLSLHRQALIMLTCDVKVSSNPVSPSLSPWIILASMDGHLNFNTFTNADAIALLVNEFEVIV